MDRRRLRRYLKRVLRCPTAPFHEYLVRDVILELLGTFPHVSVEADAFGNLVACYRRGRKRSHFAFGAHMDHPGWVRSQAGEGDVEVEVEVEGWEFLGGVPERYRVEPVIEEFGAFGMWKLPAYEEREGMIYSRACDDLVNCATILCLFEELERCEAEVTCHGIFTRAEEVGFVGAMELAKAWPLSDGVTFISLETSAPVDGVAFGEGPILRVGDRLSIFDHAVTGFIGEVAAARKIPVQRKLLDLGSCEATAFQVCGIRTAGLSMALGNYHNCGPDDRIEPEYVSMADVQGMVKLIVGATLEAGTSGGPKRRGGRALRRLLGERAGKYSTHIAATHGMFGGGGGV